MDQLTVKSTYPWVCTLFASGGKYINCLWSPLVEAVACDIFSFKVSTGLILGLHPANERWRYFVTTSLIGWVQA